MDSPMFIPAGSPRPPDIPPPDISSVAPPTSPQLQSPNLPVPRQAPSAPIGPVKSRLMNMLAGLQDGVAKAVGLPTQREQELQDYEIQVKKVQAQNAQQEEEMKQRASQAAIAQQQAQTKNLTETEPIAIPGIGVVNVPRGKAADFLKTLYTEQGKNNRAQNALDSKESIAANKGPAENESQWIAKAQAGDPIAKAKLDMLQQRRLQIQQARGAAFASAKAENTPFATFDENGNIITTTAAQAIKNGYPSAQVWNGIYGPTGSTKSQGQAAGAVAQHIAPAIDAVNKLAAKGELGAVMGRLNTYLTQGYGGNDADIAEFISTIGLLNSGAVRAHFGARGGAHILDKFQSLLNTSQEPEAIKGSLKGIQSFLETYKDVGTANPPRTGAGAKPKVGGFNFENYPKAP